MPDDVLLRGSPSERADLRASLAATKERSRALTRAFREQRIRFSMSAESIAVERRILHDDFRHRHDASA